VQASVPRWPLVAAVALPVIAAILALTV